jgi:hypothetical protein
MAEPPLKGLNGDVTFQASINEYGLFDGTIRVSELISWEDKDSSSGGSGGQASFSFTDTTVSNGKVFERKVTGQMYHGTAAPSASMIPPDANFLDSAGGIIRVGTATRWTEVPQKTTGSR